MPYRVLRPFQADQPWQAGEVVSDAQFETWPLGAKLIGRYLTPVRGDAPGEAVEAIQESSGAKGKGRG